jgi:hypothetical protein
LLLKQTHKPKAVGITFIIVGSGIPVSILLAMLLVFLCDMIDPSTGEKTDFGTILRFTAPGLVQKGV